MNTKLLVLTSLILLIVHLSGCGTSKHVQIPQAGGEQEQTDILEASGSPPAAVPMLTVFGRKLVPAMYTWRSSGELTQKLPESDANVDRNADLFVSAAPLDLRLETREAPGRVRLIYYAKHFEPAESPESELSVDCLPASPDCRVESRDGFHVVRYTRQVQDDSTLVVQVDYPTFDATDAQIGLGAYSASWVLDFGDRS